MTHITDIGVVVPGEPGTVAPEVGDRVLYTLTESDAIAINRRRQDYEAFQHQPHGRAPGESGATGHQTHVGNHASKDDVCAAEVVRVFPNAGTAANLQVKLDGNDTYWATSRCRGEGPGFWQPVGH